MARDQQQPNPATFPSVAGPLVARRRGWLRTYLLPGLLVLLILRLAAHLHDSYTWKSLRAKAAAVRVGMTQEDVSRVMGRPDRRAAADRYEKETWDRWWYSAPRLFSRNRKIQIDFDPARVNSVQELPYEQIPFDSADWKRSCAERRGFMIDDLLDRHDLRKMNRAQVIELLGEPPDSRMSRGGGLVWCLGTQRHSLFPIDDDWLVISLNEDSSVKAVGIRSD